MKLPDRHNIELQVIESLLCRPYQETHPHGCLYLFHSEQKAKDYSNIPWMFEKN